MEIRVYDKSKKNIWDDFIKKSKNGTFLLLRDYMDYHKDRFNDNSLMFYDDKDTLMAVLPANKDGNVINSHGGLTYGGLILNSKIKMPIMLSIFEDLILYCQENNIKEIMYKRVPYMYHTIPSEEDLYSLFLYNAKLYARNVSSVVKLDEEINFQTRRKRQIKKAVKNNIKVIESDEYETYWKIVKDNLRIKHGVEPVHTEEEIKKLHRLFPQNIRLFCAYKGNEVLAGVVIYETNIVAHAQYISATDEGKKLGALDFVFDHLINKTFKRKKYFDFGISNENRGKYLNKGLINQKEGFGASAIVYDQYLIKVLENDMKVED